LRIVVSVVLGEGRREMDTCRHTGAWTRCGQGDLDDNVVEVDTVERVQQRGGRLDFVCFDHALDDVLDRVGLALTRQVVHKGKDGPEAVRRVALWKKQ